MSVQGHYNLLAREEEREMAPYCQEENIALTPYSALASGRLSRRPQETQLRNVKRQIRMQNLSMTLRRMKTERLLSV